MGAKPGTVINKQKIIQSAYMTQMQEATKARDHIWILWTAVLKNECRNWLSTRRQSVLPLSYLLLCGGEEKHLPIITRPGSPSRSLRNCLFILSHELWHPAKQSNAALQAVGLHSFKRWLIGWLCIKKCSTGQTVHLLPPEKRQGHLLINILNCS